MIRGSLLASLWSRMGPQPGRPGQGRAGAGERAGPGRRMSGSLPTGLPDTQGKQAETFLVC